MADQEEKPHHEWSSRKQWVMGLVSAAIIGLAGYLWPKLTEPREPHVTDKSFVVQSAPNGPFEIKGWIQGMLSISGNQVTVAVKDMRLTNGVIPPPGRSLEPVEIASISITLNRSDRNGNLVFVAKSDSVHPVTRSIRPGETIAIEAFQLTIPVPGPELIIGGHITFIANISPFGWVSLGATEAGLS